MRGRFLLNIKGNIVWIHLPSFYKLINAMFMLYFLQNMVTLSGLSLPVALACIWNVQFKQWSGNVAVTLSPSDRGEVCEGEKMNLTFGLSSAIKDGLLGAVSIIIKLYKLRSSSSSCHTFLFRQSKIQQIFHGRFELQSTFFRRM